MPEKNKQNQKITEYFIDIFPMKFKSRLKLTKQKIKLNPLVSVKSPDRNRVALL